MEHTNSQILTKRLTLSVVAACLISFCGLITETAVNIAFPKIMADFHVSTAMVQWLTTGNLLIVAMVTPLSAFLQKRFRIRTLFLFSAVCFILGCLLALAAPNFAVLLLVRLVQGISTGVGVPIAFHIILNQIPYEKTGTFMGFGALVSAAAPALGPTFGGMVVSALGWRYIFVLLLPVLIITVILGLCTIRETGQTEKIPVDVMGILWIMAAFFCLVLGFANIAQIQERPVFVAVLLALGLICLFFFARHCAKAKQPLVDVAVFQNASFDCHLIAFFLINAVMLGASFLLPNYTQVVIGAASFTAGLTLLPGALLNAGAGPISGMILDRFGPKFPIMFGNLLMTASVILFTCLGMHLTTTLVFVLYLLFGIGCGMAFGSTMTVGMLRLSPAMKPYGNTAFNTLMQFAGAVGTCVAAACVSLSQNSAAPEQYTVKTAEGSVHGFLFLAILAVVSVLLQIGGFWSFERKQKM